MLISGTLSRGADDLHGLREGLRSCAQSTNVRHHQQQQQLALKRAHQPQSRVQTLSDRQCGSPVHRWSPRGCTVIMTLVPSTSLIRFMSYGSHDIHGVHRARGERIAAPTVMVQRRRRSTNATPAPRSAPVNRLTHRALACC
ncbi:hypothetical protein CALCODRAFT_188950 [Calocera cornea HHB12733]|uniref:Uncharacterized protein n=1 Tax=Calocera cornea HHB12733 TaxID=1353952 RepID=A0A165C8V4_9BASI|nr:hypothetical protein CALCODRAFT_188950 [Calocera cornea HHB12733]